MKNPSRVRVAGPLEPFSEDFLVELGREGYAPSSAVGQMKLIAHLSRWMAAHGVAVAELSDAAVEQFVVDRRAAGYKRHFLSARGLRPLLGFLRERGMAPEAAAVLSETPVDVVVEDYRRYLVGERSLATSTVRYYERFARLFLSRVSSGGELDLAAVTAGDVSRFVLGESAGRSVGSARTLVMALRSLLRYLHVAGLTAAPLVGAVPAVAPWRPRSLPEAIDPAVVARLLASCDRHTAVGRRDHAVLVMLARLGLRAGEVAAVELGDVDWRRGQIVVRGKGDRQEALPLPVDVGEALAGYLRRGRPRCEDRHLFVRVHAPIGCLTGDGVSRVVGAACRRAGVPVVGAHRLRRASACETLRRGGCLSEIGELLRQRSAFTTGLYAKVDRAALEQVARPWPVTA